MMTLNPRCNVAPSPEPLTARDAPSNPAPHPFPVPAYLAQQLASGALRPSEVQVLFAWLSHTASQGRETPDANGPFCTTEIASRCGLTIKATQRAKAGLVSLGVFREQPRIGSRSILTLKLDDRSCHNAPPKTEDQSMASSEKDVPSPSIDGPHTAAHVAGESTCLELSLTPVTTNPSPQKTPDAAGVSSLSPAPVNSTPEPASSKPLTARGRLTQDPVSDDAPSKSYIHTRVSSTSSSYAFKDFKNLVFTSSSETPTRNENRENLRRHDDLARRSGRLYHLFLERRPSDVAGSDGKRVPNVGEYLQVRRFLQQGVPDNLIAKAILKHRSDARHFGLIRSMVLKALGSQPRTQQGRKTQAGDSVEAQREVTHALMEVASGSDIVPPESYEGRPNADAYRPVDATLVQKWREMYPDEYR